MLLLIASFAGAQSGGFTGRVYDDFNNNGHHDQGEAGRADQMLRVSNVGFPGVSFDLMTNDEGRYQKGNLEPGLYAVHPDIPSDMIMTEPDTGGFRFVTVEAGAVANAGDIGVVLPCARVETKKMLCSVDGTGCFDWTFTITNLSAFPISHIYFLPPNPVTVQSNLTNLPNYIPVVPPIPPGGSRTFTVKICGLLPGMKYCIDMAIFDYSLHGCCLTSACFTTPLCDCLQFIEEEVICNSDGSFTFNYCVQNLSPFTVYYLLFAPSNGDVQMTPNIVALGTPIPYGGIYCGSFTIPPTAGGRPYCFWIGMADQFFRLCCSIEKCIDLPDCGGCEAQPGICAAGRLFYQDPAITPFATSAAVTTDDIFGANTNVLHIMNLSGYQCTPPPLGNNWSTQVPYKYNGPPGEWDKSRLGSVFGLTIDPAGDIYVAYSSAYFSDSVGTVGVLGGGPRQGCVYKISNGTGLATLFTTTGLPNTTSGGATDYPGLGDITYDYDNSQFFVTNEDDGKIYRLDMSGNWVAAQAFDPLTPDNGAVGFAPLGERLWAVEYHRGRVYYSVWVEDGGAGRQNATQNNCIRSVGINNAGAFIAGSDRLEVDMPSIQNIYSEPVSDISFSPEGHMGIAERTMSADTSPLAHSSRGLEFRCLDGDWKLYTGPDSNGYNGQDVFRMRTSSAGGIDYDYSPLCQGQLPLLGRRVWWTADCQPAAPNGGCDVYGLTGIRINGGSMLDNIFFDMNNDFSQQDKMLLGDVEIACPSNGFEHSPDSFEVTIGTHFAGGLPQVASSDDQGIEALNDDESGTTQVVFTGFGIPNGMTELNYSIEAHANRVGLYQVVAWYNFTTAKWLSLDSRVAPTTDQTIEMTVSTNVQRFIGPNGEVKARITWAPVNDEDPSSDGWLTSIDKACWCSN